MKALLDTNMLLAIVQFKLDVFEELRKLGYEPVLLSCVVEELEKVRRGKSKDARNAKTLLDLLKRKKLKAIGKEGPVDSALLETAKKEDYAVATNDLTLIRRLKAAGIPVIRMRQKKLLISG